MTTPRDDDNGRELRLDDALVDQVVELAEAQGRDPQELLNELLDRYLKHAQAELERKRGKA